MKRLRLSNKEVRELRDLYPFMAPILDEADVVEIIQLSEKEYIYVVDGEPLFVKTAHKELGEFIIPSLYLIHRSDKAKYLSQYPKAVVDAGAVKHIINGADVMRPGIKEVVGQFDRGHVVFIVDEKDRAIALGAALYPSAEIIQMQKGKVIINLHHLGDRIWQASLELVKKK